MLLHHILRPHEKTPLVCLRLLLLLLSLMASRRWQTYYLMKELNAHSSQLQWPLNYIPVCILPTTTTNIVLSSLGSTSTIFQKLGVARVGIETNCGKLIPISVLIVPSIAELHSRIYQLHAAPTLYTDSTLLTQLHLINNLQYPFLLGQIIIVSLLRTILLEEMETTPLLKPPNLATCYLVQCPVHFHEQQHLLSCR